jgi:hypothetical protein
MKYALFIYYNNDFVLHHFAVTASVVVFVAAAYDDYDVIDDVDAAYAVDISFVVVFVLLLSLSLSLSLLLCLTSLYIYIYILMNDNLNSVASPNL